MEGKEAHIPGAEAPETTAQTCTVCGYEVAPVLDVQQTEPQVTTPIATDPIDIEVVEKNDFPLWIPVVAICVIAVAVFFLIKKKG